MQEPSVLIRVPGKTRDQLLALRQKVYEYSWSTQLESVGAVVTRLAEQATKVQLASSTVVNKTTARPRRKAVRR